MKKIKNRKTSHSDDQGRAIGCCKVDSVISVDDRGQMVLPKDLRERAGISAGDKFAVVSWEHEGRVCCISLIKTQDFAGLVKNMLGPMMQELGEK